MLIVSNPGLLAQHQPHTQKLISECMMMSSVFFSNLAKKTLLSFFLAKSARSADFFFGHFLVIFWRKSAAKRPEFFFDTFLVFFYIEKIIIMHTSIPRLFHGNRTFRQKKVKKLTNRGFESKQFLGAPIGARNN